MGKDGDPAGITVRAPHPGGHVPPGDTSRHPSAQGSRNKARGMAAPSGMPVIPEKAKDVSILEKAHPAAFPLSRSHLRARGSSSLVPTRRGPRQGSIPVYGQQLAWLRAGSTAGQGMSRHWVSWWVLPGHLLGKRPHRSRREKSRGGEGGRHRGSPGGSTEQWEGDGEGEEGLKGRKVGGSRGRVDGPQQLSISRLHLSCQESGNQRQWGTQGGFSMPGAAGTQVDPRPPCP